MDFHLDKELRDPKKLDACIDAAVACMGKPQEITRHVSYGTGGKKIVARATSSSVKLALRLVNSNINNAYDLKVDDRDAVVRSLKVILSECVPYRVYKLDVKNFYESFDEAKTISLINGNSRLTDPVRRVIKEIVHNHSVNGHSGLPRGLVISASLSDAMMQDFDGQVSSHRDVFFYRRYVDDITIVTSAREQQVEFIKMVEGFLPPALCFKKIKTKVKSLSAFRQREKDKVGLITKYVDFEYLGYKFNIAAQGHQPSVCSDRHVWLDIAESKVNKIKTRIIKSYIDYLKTGDFVLLEMRVRHLTSNISLLDRGKGVRRLSGIHHSYPLVDIDRSISLRALDAFLRNSLASKYGSVFRNINVRLTLKEKSALARHSFYSGAKMRRFYQFSVGDLSRIQRCWKHG